jgi:TATA-box binding protein (TBP) (component of TFIID and TFIIIB)
MDFDDDLSQEWIKYLNDYDNVPAISDESAERRDTKHHGEIISPKFSPIVISTKTKIIYLNVRINLFDRFWDMPMISYDAFREGIIKKQIKFNFQNKDEVEIFEKNIKEQQFPTVVKVLNQIDNPSGRVKYKDIRKVDIGICKNDITKEKNKSKSAFYNCFVFIYRIKIDNKFKEIHIKLFNSGKIEIPGIQDEMILDVIIDYIISLLQPHYLDTKIVELKERRETILINSNFRCNYFINREELFNILKTKYNIKCSYDPCSYPGVQCKYKLPNAIVSYMIFRTGSVLIVGKCNDEQLYGIYEFVKKILLDEIESIYENNNEEQPKKLKKKVKKIINIQSNE